jgi:hypothetical protein
MANGHVGSENVQGVETKNPAQGRAVVKRKDDNELPGWIFNVRSARARRHAGSHAGAGEDVGGEVKAHAAHGITAVAAAQ